MIQLLDIFFPQYLNIVLVLSYISQSICINEIFLLFSCIKFGNVSSNKPLIKLTFLLNGFVNISPTYDGLRDVAITWLVTTEDGKVVGKSTQNNKVSKGSLNMEWGKVAEDVVLKGSTAILDIMMKYLTLHNIKN